MSDRGRLDGMIPTDWLPVTWGGAKPEIGNRGREALRPLVRPRRNWETIEKTKAMASMSNVAPTSAPVGTVRRVHSQCEFGVRLGLSLAAFLQMSQQPAYSRMSRLLARLRRPLLPQIWSRPG